MPAFSGRAKALQHAWTMYWTLSQQMVLSYWVVRKPPADRGRMMSGSPNQSAGPENWSYRAAEAETDGGGVGLAVPSVTGEPGEVKGGAEPPG